MIFNFKQHTITSNNESFKQSQKKKRKFGKRRLKKLKKVLEWMLLITKIIWSGIRLISAMQSILKMWLM